MPNVNNKQRKGLLNKAFGVAKKLSQTGFNLIEQVAPGSVAVENKPIAEAQAIPGEAKVVGAFDHRTIQTPQHLLKQQFPDLSRRVLGRHYSKVNNVAHFVSPNLSEKIADYVFETLNDFSSNYASIERVLDEAGLENLEELTKDESRSQRIAKALAEQNKWIATVQGAFSGSTGLLGTAVDIPASLLLSLRTIYQVGRAYGFELNQDKDHEVIQHIFKQIDLSLLAEKQAILMGLKALSATIQTHDVQQLQQLLGSNNDFQVLKPLFVNETGEFKFSLLNKIPKISVLSKLTPLAGAGVGAVYSWRLVDDVQQKAQHLFGEARHYLLEHKELLSPLIAYERAIQNKDKQDNDEKVDALTLNEDVGGSSNNVITNVKLEKKTEKSQENVSVTTDDKVNDGLEQLANEMVNPVAKKTVQKPAHANQVDEFEGETLFDVSEEISESKVDENDLSEKK